MEVSFRSLGFGGGDDGAVDRPLGCLVLRGIAI